MKVIDSAEDPWTLRSKPFTGRTDPLPPIPGPHKSTADEDHFKNKGTRPLIILIVILILLVVIAAVVLGVTLPIVLKGGTSSPITRDVCGNYTHPYYPAFDIYPDNCGKYIYCVNGSEGEVKQCPDGLEYAFNMTSDHDKVCAAPSELTYCERLRIAAAPTVTLDLASYVTAFLNTDVELECIVRNVTTVSQVTFLHDDTIVASFNLSHSTGATMNRSLGRRTGSRGRIQRHSHLDQRHLWRRGEVPVSGQRQSGERGEMDDSQRHDYEGATCYSRGESRLTLQIDAQWDKQNLCCRVQDPLQTHTTPMETCQPLTILPLVDITQNPVAVLGDTVNITCTIRDLNVTEVTFLASGNNTLLTFYTNTSTIASNQTGMAMFVNNSPPSAPTLSIPPIAETYTIQNPTCRADNLGYNPAMTFAWTLTREGGGETSISDSRVTSNFSSNSQTCITSGYSVFDGQHYTGGSWNNSLLCCKLTDPTTGQAPTCVLILIHNRAADPRQVFDLPCKISQPSEPVTTVVYDEWAMTKGRGEDEWLE
ncbi:hypothetical protein C0Q70_20997 [Pomacea canaliculata]|uniref:Chitin-binding type-2 domain-containing protein n=1 Tax=Pomacea canaliculata TaxID=400727 RepID=A0A2T7NBA1_POMCA|nr:hypothetical protein C0Q70_20997 [Pomacea canaliculata]